MPEPVRKMRRSERGAALLTVLLLVAVMSVVAAGALERVTLATRLVGNAGAMDQSRAYAQSAETIARIRLADLVAATPGKTTLEGGWLGAPQTMPVPGGTAQVTVFDGGNCFNLNSLVTGSDENSLKIRPVGILQFQGLMQVLGIDPRIAQQVAASTADWIDTDSVPQPGGAEDDFYLRQATPYRTANRFMTDASELRAVAGVTPAIYTQLKPWICALPTSDLSPLNVNTLLPEQAPLFAMLIPGKLSVAQARQLLAQRPEGGYGSTVGFWALPALKSLTPLTEVSNQVRLTTRWFRVRIRVDVGGTQLDETALIDAQEKPARLLRRQFGGEA